ncbi:hypothetical protein POM88_021393 [Heracleum sosnowskyi]|uniref:Protein kinase domain-containing protein n=1 Tax=Heracleum sosnowskyi TaxID=360622 RepID=A0AAD8MTS1_9APIA|nr:hypothetical protein POM88_021393 [Heracleum sosnowskyi]
MGEGFPLSGYTGWEHAMPFWPQQYLTDLVRLKHIRISQRNMLHTLNGLDIREPGGPYVHNIWREPVSSTTPASDIKTSQQKRQHPAPNKQPESSSKSGKGFPRPKPSSCPVNDKGLPLRPLTSYAVDLSLKGSPHWMAPEVLLSMMRKDSKLELAFAVDIWSVGCTVIEMLTGKPPWSEYSGVQNCNMQLRNSLVKALLPGLDRLKDTRAGRNLANKILDLASPRRR